MNPSIISIALKRIQAKQSKGELRKESTTSLITLLGVVSMIIPSIIDIIPAEWTIVASVLTGIAAAVSFYVDRFTVPALTEKQKDRILASVNTVEQQEASKGNLPVYDFDSTSATTE